MTSKKALGKLCCCLISKKPQDDESLLSVGELSDIVDRDLEVLEIIKKKTHNDGWGNGYVVHFWEMEEDELEKIKKWWEGD